MNVNIDRLEQMLNDLGKIGFKEREGTSRLSYTKEYEEGREYIKKVMEDAGMETQIDRVGNLIGRLKGRSSKIISMGSHIDTVPGGGIFDGALGVLSGIECIYTLQENGYVNHHTLEVIAFIEEEGNVIGGTFGSKTFTGQKQESDAIKKTADWGISKEDINHSRRNQKDYECFLELHIEQGGILEQKQIPIGVVTGIVGIVRYLITVHGVSNHAGSTPMYLRDDALVKACKMVTRLTEISNEINPDMTCTIGKMEVLPGAVNVIPNRVQFPVELRCMSTEDITAVIEIFQKEFAEQSIEIDNFLWQDETVMDGRIGTLIRESCTERGILYQEMPSGAGHDSINMALFTHTAMIFIPSIGGISHSIKEKSSKEDILTGSNILLDTIIKMDANERGGGE